MNFFILNSGKCDPAFNMALDEALLEAMSRLNTPVFRFYGWTEPAASFGYFQRYTEVERATPLRPLIRRPTGGGIVPHDRDWTYSLVFPPAHEWHSFKAEESYRRVHEWIRSAFAELGIGTELAPCCRRPTPDIRRSPQPSACFTGYVKSDLLWHGKKIAGAAQRRNKLGLLIQGSVQPPLFQKAEDRRQKAEAKNRPSDLTRTNWEKAMCRAAQREFGIQWNELVLAGELSERAAGLTREKYSRTSFNQMR